MSLQRVSDFKSLVIRIFVIGYSEKGESIICLFLDKEDNHIIYSFVIDSFKVGGINKTVEILNSYGIRDTKLDMVIWSHPDKDHTYGFDTIIDDFCTPSTVFALPNDLADAIWIKINNNKDDKDLIDEIHKKASEYYDGSYESVVVADNQVHPLVNFEIQDNWDNVLPININALTPHSRRINNLLRNRKYLEKNDLSVAICLEVGGNYKYKFLFLSDVEEDEINKIIPNVLEDPLFIKIPHHTSKSSANLLSRIDNEDFKPIACTTTYKVQGLPDKVLLNDYLPKSKIVDCTGFKDERNLSHGVVEYSFDLYGQHEVEITRDGNAQKVTAEYIETFPY